MNRYRKRDLKIYLSSRNNNLEKKITKSDLKTRVDQDFLPSFKISGADNNYTELSQPEINVIHAD